MKKLLVLTCLIGLIIAGTALAEDPPWTSPPSPTIIDRGLVVHLDGDGQPTTYGELTDDGGWDYSVPGIGSTPNRDARNIYYTTDALGTQTAMDDTAEWVIQILLKQQTPDGNRIIEFWGLGGDILQFIQDGANWYMTGDQSIFGSVIWFETAPPLDEYFTLTVHYQPDHWHSERTKAMDVWVNDGLAYGGITAKNQILDFDLTGIALKGNADYDEILIGGIPEPMTMALLGMGGLAVLRRKRS